MNTTLTRMNGMLSQDFADIASPGACMDGCGLWLVVTDLDAWYELRDGPARPAHLGDASDITLEQARAAAVALRDERARKEREEAARIVQAQRDRWMRYVAQQNDERLLYRHPLKPRYVFDVHETAPSETTKQWLDMIGEFYGIEADIRGKPPDERRRVRQEKSSPLLAALETSMRQKLATLWPKAPLVEAINYSLNRWDGLTLFCDDGRVEISNVLAENALRCVALGRRNYMFAGSDSGGERAAAMYSLIGSCKLNGINPRAYLEYVLPHIADHQANRIDELLPWNVAKHLLPTIPASS